MTKRITRIGVVAMLLLVGLPGRAQEVMRPLEREVQTVAARYALDAELIHAVIGAESSYNPLARSPKGAQGLMQLIPATARRFGVGNPYDPIENLHGGARYLRWLLDFFQGNVALALAGYNAGEGAVLRYGGIPPYAETQAYVGQVLNRWRERQSPRSLSAATVRAATSLPRSTPVLPPAQLNPYTADTTVFTRLRTRNDAQPFN
jgi:soluble lytic murein transglycosylase-like protein